MSLNVLVNHLDDDLPLRGRHVVAPFREEEDHLDEVDSVSLVGEGGGHLVDESYDASEHRHAFYGAVLGATLRHFEKPVDKAVLKHVAEVSVHFYISVVRPRSMPCF